MDDELLIEKSEDCEDDGVRSGLEVTMGDDCGLEVELGEVRVLPYG